MANTGLPAEDLTGLQEQLALILAESEKTNSLVDTQSRKIRDLDRQLSEIKSAVSQVLFAVNSIKR